MATLPTVFAARPAPRPSRGLATVSNAGAVGAAVEGLGAGMNVIGMQILDREATAAAKEADARISDEIRALLYDPETGFANQRGGSAVAAREAILAKLDGLAASATVGLNKAAAQKLKDSIDGRIERAKGTVDSHTSGERATWIDGARDARMNSAYQDILADPSVAPAELLRIEGEIRGRAADKGWSSEQTQFEIEKAKSTAHRGVAEKIATVDPAGAAAYLQENRGSMIGSDISDLEAKLIPLAKEAEGRALGAAAASGHPIYKHNTQISFAMGPNRPNKPAAPVLSVIGKSVEDVFGAGAKVVVTSGQENEGHQHGSNRHGTGHAADIQIIRPDGSVVGATDPEMKTFARVAAQNGALGIGFGSEYMGGTHVHVDLVEPGAGQANTWASGGAAMREEIVGIIGSRAVAASGGLRAILDEPDPVKRAAALREYELITSVAEGEAKARRAYVSQTAYDAVLQGTNPNDLPYDIKSEMGGEAFSSLMAQARSIASGVPVETDMTTYADLRMMAADNPAAFANLDINVYADRLSAADHKSLVEIQAKPMDRVEGMALSSMMSVAESHLKRLKIDADDPREGIIKSQLLRWQDEFIAKGNGKPTQFDVDQKIGQMLTEVVINPPGIGNEKESLAFQTFEIDPEGLVTSDISLDGVLVPQGEVQSLVDAMKGDGLEVTADTVIDLLLRKRGQ